MAENEKWFGKGKTLSDKSAMKRYGLTKEEIETAIKQGKLQYRLQSTFGSPWYRLLTTEVEDLVAQKEGSNYLEKKKLEKELKEIRKKIRKHKRSLKKLEDEEKGLEKQLELLN